MLNLSESDSSVYAAGILRDTGILDEKELTPSDKVRIGINISRYVNQMIHEAVFDRLDDSQGEMITQMLQEERTQEEIDLILQTFIPDLQELRKGIMDDYRAFWLKGWKENFG